MINRIAPRVNSRLIANQLQMFLLLLLFSNSKTRSHSGRCKPRLKQTMKPYDLLSCLTVALLSSSVKVLPCKSKTGLRVGILVDSQLVKYSDQPITISTAMPHSRSSASLLRHIHTLKCTEMLPSDWLLCHLS